MAKNLLHIIEEKRSGFSKGQRLIADYILNHYEKAAYMTASRLGHTVGVSESTVVRFAAELGFEGYPQLQKSLQDIIRNRLTTVQRMEIIDEQLSGGVDVLHRVMSSDADKIRRTQEEIPGEDFDAVVNTIIGARRIYILGLRSSGVLAGFLSFYFNHIFEDVVNVGAAQGETFEQMLRIGPEDVLIAISFPRYSQRTLKAVHYAKKQGACIIGITDSTSAPLAAMSNQVLLARSEMASFVDSLVAPMSLLNAIIVAVGLRKKHETSNTYAMLEQIWSDYDVYEKNEEIHSAP